MSIATACDEPDLRCQVATPVILWGTHDVIIPVRLGQEVRRLMPSATYVEIPAGLLPQYEQPDLTNEAILRFLDGVARLPEDVEVITTLRHHAATMNVVVGARAASRRCGG